MGQKRKLEDFPTDADINGARDQIVNEIIDFTDGEPVASLSIAVAVVLIIARRMGLSDKEAADAVLWLGKDNPKRES